MNTTDDTIQQIEYDDYIQVRKDLDQLRIQQINQLDKALLTLSSSALGVSLALRTALGEKISETTLVFIGFSWICFTFAITLNLVSYYLAARATEKQIGELDNAFPNLPTAKMINNWFISLTKFANVVAILFFLLGTIALLIFAYKNL